MKSNPFYRALPILLALVFLVIGVVHLANPSASSVGFSTSYQDSPDLKSMPTSDPKDVVGVPGLIQSFDVSSDGGMIAIATSKGLILYDLKTLREIRGLLPGESIDQVAFSPDGSKLAVGAVTTQYAESGSQRVTAWDIVSWNMLYEFKSDRQGYDPFSALAWAPDGERLAFSMQDRGLSVVDVDTGKSVAALEDFMVTPFDLSWSPDGLRLISNGDGIYGLRRWRVDTDEWVRLFDARPYPAMQVRWSPDGQQIASGHYGGTVCVWNAANNRCEGFIRAHFNSVDGLAWSPDGSQIATASGAIRIWDSRTGKMISAFGFYDGLIYNRLRWLAPQTIATLESSYTQNVSSTIRFWDVSSGDVILAFRGWDNIQSANTGGLALRLDDVQISSDRTILQVSLRFDSPGTFIAGHWNLTMADSKGRIYPLTDVTAETMDAGVKRIYQTVPLQAGEHITLDLTSFPQRGQMPLAMDLSTAPGTFAFAPQALQIGEAAALDEEIDVNGYLLHLTGARKISAAELLFEFETDGYITGALLHSPWAGGSSNKSAADGKFTATLSFPEMPNGPIEVDVTRLYYNASGPWPLEFEVAKSMFTDLPAVTPALTPTTPAAPALTSQEPLFLEAQALTGKFRKSILESPGWVHVVSTHMIETPQEGQTYPPPYYQEEQWFEIDPEGRVTRSLTTHLDRAKNILQQSVSVGTHHINLTIGEAMEFPMYQLSLDWLLPDLDYALNHGQTVLREETACEDDSPCLLITIIDANIGRRAWIDMETGQQVQIQTFQQMPGGTEKTLFTQTFLPVERVETPPQEVLGVFSRILFPVP